jgi:hypothetical protein
MPGTASGFHGYQPKPRADRVKVDRAQWLITYHALTAV